MQANEEKQLHLIYINNLSAITKIIIYTFILVLHSKEFYGVLLRCSVQKSVYLNAD